MATHHDCIYERFPIFRFTKTALRAKKKLFAAADLIICDTESSRTDLLQFYEVDAAKTRVVHLGFSRLLRSPESADELGGRIRRDYILYVSGRSLYKNFRGLLRAFRDTRLHETLDLLVLGGGPLTRDERDLIAKLGIGESVVAIPIADEVFSQRRTPMRDCWRIRHYSRVLGFRLWRRCISVVRCWCAMHHRCRRYVEMLRSITRRNEPESLREALLRGVDDDTRPCGSDRRGTK